MKIELKEHICIVTKEPGDPKYYGVVHAAGESKLFYAIKNQLNKEKDLGLIKKRMYKDGHLVDDLQQYICNKDRSICIYNSNWSVSGAEEYFNQGRVVLTVENCKR